MTDPQHAQQPTVDPADEGTHPPTGEQLWNESYYLDFVDPALGVAGYVRLGVCAGLGQAWYWACLVGEDRPLVTVIDHEVPLPVAPSREVRTEGLWADYTVEEPVDHVTVGVEAFGVSVEDPAEVYRDLRGDRVPLGFDLEWETDGGNYPYPGVTRYEIPCRVHGQVLVGNEELEIDGFGQRDHSWGTRDWWAIEWSWTAGRLDDGTRFHGTSVALGGEPVYGTGYLQAPEGPLVGTDSVARDQVLGPHGLPSSATWRVADLALTVEPVAFAPVGLVGPDGRMARFPRAWCRFTANDGRTGHGWTEWNQVSS